MKLEKILTGLISSLVISSIGVTTYVMPTSFTTDIKSKEIVESYFNFTYPITPVRIETKRLFGLCGMYLPPNLILHRESCERPDIEIHELIHMEHFYTDFISMLNRNYEERRTDIEEYKIKEGLK